LETKKTLKTKKRDQNKKVTTFFTSVLETLSTAAPWEQVVQQIEEMQ